MKDNQAILKTLVQQLSPNELNIHIPNNQNTLVLTAKLWSLLISKGEKPAKLSSRDGVKLKKVPQSIWLDQDTLFSCLQQGYLKFENVQKFAEEVLVKQVSAQEQNRKDDYFLPQKWKLYLMRALAYFSAGQLNQSCKDARFALSYAPSKSQSIAEFVLGVVLQAQNNFSEAALHLQKACEQDPSNQHYKQQLNLAIERLSPSQADALEQGGSNGIFNQMEIEKQQKLPPFLQQKEKYYYYNQWMTERIRQTIEYELPEPVLNKLLLMDAGELDLLIQNPQGIKQQSQKLLDCYVSQGEVEFSKVEVPKLSWEDVKQITGPNTVGLGMNNMVIRDGEKQLMLESPEYNQQKLLQHEHKIQSKLIEFEDLNELN